ncbi:MAG: TrpB-like pyridoxal-phosphate dependent enzyme, partial [Dehalococcoidales bacterium]
MERTKFVLDEKDMPTSWYNILPDLPEPLPAVLHPGRGDAVTPDDLAPLFPMGLIMQEFSPESWIDIPEEILSVYRTWRP